MRFHTSLPVKNIHDTVTFYRILFDADSVKTKRDYASFSQPTRGSTFRSTRALSPVSSQRCISGSKCRDRPRSTGCTRVSQRRV